MLKILCVFACALLCFFSAMPVTAFAETEVTWVRIVDDGVRLYANSDNSKAIFELAKSYYLEVWGEENGMYLVSVMQNTDGFLQITGYVWKAEVEPCDEPPVAPYYPTEKITVTSDSVQLKLSPVPSAETIVTVTNTQKLNYYGELTSYGEKWFYVYYCGKFGYISADGVTKPVIKLHPTPLTQEVVVPPTPTTPETPVEPSEPSGNVSEIFLIIFVVLLAAGICLALFLPGNIKKRDVYDKDI